MPLRLANRSFSLAVLLSACLATVLTATGADSTRANSRPLASRSLIVGVGSRFWVQPFMDASLALQWPLAPDRAVRLELILANEITAQLRPTSSQTFSDWPTNELAYRVNIQNFVLGLQAVKLKYRAVDPALNIFYGLGPRLVLKVFKNETPFDLVTPDNWYGQDPIEYTENSIRRLRVSKSFSDSNLRATLGAALVFGFSYRLNEHLTWHGEYGSFLESYFAWITDYNVSDYGWQYIWDNYDKGFGLEFYSGVTMGLSFTI